VRSNPRSNFLRKFSFGSHGKDHLDVATNKEKKKTWIIASSARKTRNFYFKFQKVLIGLVVAARNRTFEESL
jgi:hypothetical protein